MRDAMMNSFVGMLTGAEVTLAHDSIRMTNCVPPWPRHPLTEEAE